MLNAQGRELTAREVEHGFGLNQGAEERFASLCNAIAWAESRRRAMSLPSFTERVKVKDYGIDAEWDVEVADDGDDHPLLGPGWNVYQYKMRDLSTDDRTDLVSGLVSDLKGGSKKKAALADMHERTGRRPARYVLFTNLDLTHPTVKKGEKGQKERLREAILEGYDDPGGVRVEIVGAAELAAFLNGLPHVRYAYFGGPRFATAWEELGHHKKAEGFRAGVALVGRDAEMGRISSFLEDADARAMVVSGSHGMGKTRLVLEATTRERPVETVVALGGSSLEVSELRALRSEGHEVVLVAEDPGVSGAGALVREALGGDGLKVIVTSPTAEGEPVPGYRRNNGRMRHMSLEPLDYEASRELLRAAGAELGFGVGLWVVERADGNPGILLAAAEAGPELEQGGATPFAEEVGKTFEDRVRRELGEDALRTVEALSVLARTGVGGVARKELYAVVEALSDGPTVNEVLKALPRLEQAGLVRRRREYAEAEYADVTPAFFANHLAASALLGRDEVPASLLGALDGSARERLLDRLRNLGSEEVARFWDGLFGLGGPLRDLLSALDNPHLLVPAAAAVPERTARLVEGGLSKLDVAMCCEIGGQARRQLVYALQELLARERTAEAALRCLLLLAEAENEDYGNNATGVFSESFRPIHPLVALPLERRLHFLRRTMLDGGVSLGARKVAVRVAEGLSIHGMVLYQGGGTEPLEGRPAMTYGEAWDYFEGLVDLLMEATRSSEEPLAEAAGEVLPRATADLALQGRPEKAAERMEEVVRWAIRHEVPVPISELVDQLRRVHRRLDGLAKAWEANTENPEAPEKARELRAHAERMERSKEALEKGDFRTRLERWAGSWTGGGIEMVPDGSGGTIFKYVSELRELAREAAEDPEKLPEELLSWAIDRSEAQKRHAFFLALGEFDTDRVWQARLEQAGGHEAGAIAFAGYFGGTGRRDARLAGLRLDELAATGGVTEEALLRATAEIGGGEAAIERVETVAQGHPVRWLMVHVLLSGRWVETLSPDQLERLLSALAGSKLDNALAVVKAASYWPEERLRELEEASADLLWRCLEEAHTQSIYDVIECDRLAAELSRARPDRGFALLEHLLRRPYRFGDWDPAGPDHQEFWKALCEADRQRALRTVLSLAAQNRQMMSAVSIAFTGVLDQERDADLLLSAAGESRAQAEVVAHMLNAAQPGFWPLAVKILERYPGDEPETEPLRGELLDRSIYAPVGVVNPEGPELIRILERSLRELEQMLQASAVPDAVRPLIQEYVEHLRGKIERDLLSKAAEEADTFRSGRFSDPKEAKEATQTFFAVRRLLELRRLDLARQTFSRDDLLRLLPKLKFSEQDEEGLRPEIERGE